MVNDETIDEILGNVIMLVRNLKMSAGEVCSLFPIERPDGTESALSVAQYRMVIYLYRRGQSSVGEVASDSGVTMATASQMLDKLVESGWVERGVNPDDRRQVLVWLTESAKAVSREIHGYRRQQVREALESLPEDDAATVLRIFRAFNQSIAPRLQDGSDSGERPLPFVPFPTGEIPSN